MQVYLCRKMFYIHKYLHIKYPHTCTQMTLMQSQTHACIYLLGKQNNQYCIQKMIPKHHIVSIFQGSNDYLVPEPQNAKTNKPKRNLRAKHCISSFMGKLLEGQTHSTSERGVGEKHRGLSPLPVTVTTRIITFFVGDPYKPSFATVTGRVDNPKHITEMNYC